MVEVFVVDDESGIVELCKDALANQFSVRTFTQPLEALESLKQGHVPRLILTDLKMPTMDGFSFNENLKQICPELPVCMMSAYADKHHLQHLIESNFDGFIEKPFELDVLRSKVDEIVRKYQMRHFLEEMVDDFRSLCSVQKKLIVAYFDRLKNAEEIIFKAGIDSEKGRPSVEKFLQQLQYQSDLEREMTRLDAKIESLNTRYVVENVTSQKSSSAQPAKKKGHWI